MDYSELINYWINMCENGQGTMLFKRGQYPVWISIPTRVQLNGLNSNCFKKILNLYLDTP
jgi:hypothetical protein